MRAPITPTSGSRILRTLRNRKQATLAALLVLGTAAVYAPVAAADPNPITCAGYAQNRVFLEAQGWWTKPGLPVGMASEHVHVATCFPWKQTLGGLVRFDVRVMVHNLEPGSTLKRTRIHTYNGGGSTLATIEWGNYVCLADDCTLWKTVYVDTKRSRYDGRQEFRFLTSVGRPDGREIHVSTRWQAYLSNGKTVRNYRSSDNYMGAAGWYTDRGYQTALMPSGIPLAPVAGVWTPSVKLAHGSDAFTSTRHFVAVDPNFHMGMAGTVVKEGAGEYSGKVGVDTTRLSNGAHRLIIRVDQNGTQGTAGTVSGAFAIPFTVQN